MGEAINGRQSRTLLERLIRERNQTLEEFAESVETFAREHSEPGTLSLRHLQRLIAGRYPDGRPVGRPRPATARLLESMLGYPIDHLLEPPEGDPQTEDDKELRARIATAHKVDESILALLHEQLNGIRRIDRELGAIVAHEEVRAKMAQVQQLFAHSLMPQLRQQLAALLSELGTLAGWQALDLGRATEAWKHYETGRTAAAVSESAAYEAHAMAEQAFVLADVGEHKAAAELTASACQQLPSSESDLLGAWLHAAHGETLAHLGEADDSQRAFDEAAEKLDGASTISDGQPYVVLDDIHLARWRGNALVRLNSPSALPCLTYAESQLDASFSRAGAGLHIDLATALHRSGEYDAAYMHKEKAQSIVERIHSERQRRRVNSLAGEMA